MSKLVFLGEKFGGRSYEFVPEKTTVGRGDQNTLTIRDTSVSDVHCEILVNGPEVIVHDLGSANGTFVNGERVNGQCQVKHDQIIRFGSVEARLELNVEPWDDSATEQTAVHVMGRIMRDQRRERNKPPPADPSMTLEAGPPADVGDHTVLLTRPVQSPASPPAGVPAPPPKSRNPFLTVVAVGVLGLAAFLYWLFWRGK